MRSSNCLRVIGARLSRMRFRPSHQAAANPTRYMRPYQRTASGPTEKAIGLKSGWTSMMTLLALLALLAAAARVRDEVACRGGEGAARPREPEVEARVPVGELAVRHAAASEVGNRARDDRYAQAARHQAHYGLHLDGLLRHVERDTGPRGQRAHDIVQARSDVARHQHEGVAGELTDRQPARPAGEAVPGRKRGDEALALHDEVLEVGFAVDRRQEQPEVELARAERRGLLGGKHFAQRERHAGPEGLEALEQRGKHPVVGERNEADAQAPLLARGDAPQRGDRALELCDEPARLFQKARAFGGELDAPAAAREEYDAETLLERAG